MRKTAVFLFMLFSLMNLNAQIFRSNQLGQKLERADRVEDKGVFLVEEGQTETLYVDGSLFWTERKLVNPPDETVVIRIYEKTQDELSRTYKDGRLVKEEVTSSGFKTTQSFGYSDGKLIFVSTDGENGSVSVQSFLRSSDKKDVIGVSDDGSVRFLSDRYSFQNDLVLENLAPGLVTNGEHRILENGDILIIEDTDTQSVYSPKGLLLSSKKGDRLVSYMYDDEYLIRVETTDGASKTVENYSDNKPYDRYEYENEVLISHTVFRPEGSVKTMYSQGRVVAVVYYRKDNRTVDRIEYN